MDFCKRLLLTSIEMEFAISCHEKTSIGMLLDLNYCTKNPPARDLLGLPISK
jgi:hypothetical protein